jgi:hypothetical protein
LNIRSRFGLFVSSLKIPFPGKRDFGSKRLGSNALIIELEGRAPDAGGAIQNSILSSLRRSNRREGWTLSISSIGSLLGSSKLSSSSDSREADRTGIDNDRDWRARSPREDVARLCGAIANL